MFNHKPGSQNQVANALSKDSFLLTALQIELVGFQHFKEQYPIDPDFHGIWHKCSIYDATTDLHIQSGFLFKADQLCVP